MSNNKYFLSLLLNFLVIVLYVLLFFYKSDNLLVMNYFSSLFIAFFAENSRSYKKPLLNNSAIILLLFLFLYGIFNSIISLIFDTEITNSVYFATLFYGSAIPAFSIGSLLSFSNNNTVVYIYPKKVDRNYKLLLYFILVILFIYKSYFLYTQNLLFNPSIVDETARFILFENFSQLWVVSGYLISGIFLYFIYVYKFLKKRDIIVLFLMYLFYASESLAIGNRREIIIILIGVFWVWVTKKQTRFKFITFLSFLFGIFIFLVLSNFRSSNLDEGLGIFVATSLMSNEFVYPFFTLSLTVQNWIDNNFNPLLGLSLFAYPVLIFIPRVIFPMKPNSLAMDFVITNFGGGMGYAFTPVTEAFVNFGPIGPFILFLFLGILVAKLMIIKDQRFIFLFFTMIPDFCRGEISSLIYQFVIVSTFLILIPMFSKLLVNSKFIK